ncbi:MAG: hypothetical protein R3Y56_10360 [Akkermansia sp.]
MKKILVALILSSLNYQAWAQAADNFLQDSKNSACMITCTDPLPMELHSAAILCIKQNKKLFGFMASYESPLNYVKVKRLILPQQEDGTQHYLLSGDVGSGLYCPLSCILHFDQKGQCQLGEYFVYSTSQANDYPRYQEDGKLF